MRAAIHRIQHHFHLHNRLLFLPSSTASFFKATNRYSSGSSSDKDALECRLQEMEQRVEQLELERREIGAGLSELQRHIQQLLDYVEASSSNLDQTKMYGDRPMGSRKKKYSFLNASFTEKKCSNERAEVDGERMDKKWQKEELGCALDRHMRRNERKAEPEVRQKEGGWEWETDESKRARKSDLLGSMHFLSATLKKDTQPREMKDEGGWEADESKMARKSDLLGSMHFLDATLKNDTQQRVMADKNDEEADELKSEMTSERPHLMDQMDDDEGEDKSNDEDVVNPFGCIGDRNKRFNMHFEALRHSLKTSAEERKLAIEGDGGGNERKKEEEAFNQQQTQH